MLVKTGSDLQARSVQAPGVHLQKSWVRITGAADKVQLPLGPGLLTLSVAHPVYHMLIFLYVHMLCVQGDVSGKEDSAVSRRAAAGCAGIAFSFCSGWTHKQDQAAPLASARAGP